MKLLLPRAGKYFCNSTNIKASCVCFPSHLVGIIYSKLPKMFSGDFHSGTKASYLKHLPKPKGRLWHPLQRVFEDLGLNISSLTCPQKGPIPGSSRGHY